MAENSQRKRTQTDSGIASTSISLPSAARRTRPDSEISSASMPLPSAPKRQQRFDKSWEIEYFYCQTSDDRAMCVICRSNVGRFSKSVLSNHYNSKHADIYSQFVDASREEKFRQLKNELCTLLPTIKERDSSTKSADVSTLASYKIAYQIALTGRPFTDGKFLKNVIETAFETLHPPSKSLARNLALSPSTVSSRISEIANDIRRQFGTINFNFYSIALDESTDYGKIAQLAIYIRVWNEDDKSIVEDLLEVMPLHNRTRGQDIYNALIEALKEYSIPLNKMVSLITDGAPAMIGHLSGVGARIIKEVRKTTPDFNLLVLHCMIHQQVLCSKTLQFHHVLDAIVKIIQYIRGTPLMKRTFTQFLKDVNSQYETIPYYTDIRWLSCYKVLNRFHSLKVEIIQFLNQQRVMKNHEIILEPEWQMDCCFFTDLAKSLYHLNLSLQGGNKLAWGLYFSIGQFLQTLQISADSLRTGNLAATKFLLCQQYQAEHEGDPNISFSRYSKVLDDLKTTFETRFQEFRQWEKELIIFENPFSFNTSDRDTKFSEEIRNELLIINGRNDLQNIYADSSTLEFYKVFPFSEYPQFGSFAAKMLTCFGSTYVCEQLFSALKRVKSSDRSSLSDRKLQDQLKICATKNFVPDFELLALQKGTYTRASNVADNEFEMDENSDSDYY